MIGSVLHEIVENYLSTGDAEEFWNRCYCELTQYLQPSLMKNWGASFTNPRDKTYDALSHATEKLKEQLDKRRTDITAFPTYCKRAAENYLIDEWRKEKRHSDEIRAMDEFTASGREPCAPQVVTELDLKREELELILRRVSKSDQELLGMVRAGLKGIQIAEKLGITPQAVSKRKQECIKRLRRASLEQMSR